MTRPHCNHVQFAVVSCPTISSRLHKTVAPVSLFVVTAVVSKASMTSWQHVNHVTKMMLLGGKA